LLVINSCPGNNTEASGGNDCLVIIPPHSKRQEIFVLLLTNAVSVLQRPAFILKRYRQSNICMDTAQIEASNPTDADVHNQCTEVYSNYNGVVKRHRFNEWDKSSLPRSIKLQLNTNNAVGGPIKIRPTQEGP